MLVKSRLVTFLGVWVGIELMLMNSFLLRKTFVESSFFCFHGNQTFDIFEDQDIVFSIFSIITHI